MENYSIGVTPCCWHWNAKTSSDLLMAQFVELMLARIWDRCNALVKSWITSNVSKEFLSGILSRPDAYFVWNDLKEKFDRDETDSTVPMPSCCDKSKDFVTHLKNHRLLQFLIGLNDGYNQACSQILMMSPTPLVNQASAMITQDESQKLVSGGGYRLGEHNDPTTLFTKRNTKTYEEFSYVL
ncbi:uncharacterized protein [Nicotiana sylvestris]|uniref:Uncharacterized protein LOC104235042 n=1 Tax=Nicotiana sylvestris TaxID=4096 RepID=A0A1U7X4I8_NICSY|nr:PREDICTED: uncharacterized protein LOC104235042 [Nicotiana sylvestris]